MAWSRPSDWPGKISRLCFVNLVDFDALWGHRRNPQGYAAEIERFDVKLENCFLSCKKRIC